MVTFVILFIIIKDDMLNFFSFCSYLLVSFFNSVIFLINLDYLTDNCLKLEGSGYLNHYKCVDIFISGCPTTPYTDEEIYKCK